MKMLIGGKWIDKEERIQVKNPYDGSLVTPVELINQPVEIRSISSLLLIVALLQDTA